MSPDEREWIIQLLALITGYRPSAFEKLTDDELQSEYDKRYPSQT